MEGRALIGVKPTTPCILHEGYIKPNGYGQVTIGRKKFHAHRLAYEKAYGEIPAGMDVCHACDNRACINPEHLWIGTRSSNMADCSAKGRLGGAVTREKALRGETHPQSKLTAAAVRTIRQLRAQGATYASLAAKFGVSKRAVLFAVQGKTWADTH